jgi:hypothetical protein
MLIGSDMDVSKLPVNIQPADYIEKVELNALGVKPVVVPVFKNNILFRSIKSVSIIVFFRKNFYRQSKLNLIR